MNLRYLGAACSLLTTAMLLAGGCSSNPEFIAGGEEGPGDGTGGGENLGGSRNGGGIDLNPGTGNGTGGGGPVIPVVTPCGDIFCTEDQQCAVVDKKGACIPNTCEELGCKDSEECLENSLGAHCEDLSCTKDLDCASARYCDTDAGFCKEDACIPGNRSCSSTGEAGETGSDVFICSSSGSGFVKETTCAGAGAFSSACNEAGEGVAGCSCEDDWDCPGFQQCEAGACAGSLTAPTCRLPAADINDVLPAQEIVWGTASDNSDKDGRLQILDGVQMTLADGSTAPAVGESALAAWPNYVQVTQTPVVANLDDDNGDGLIDERDVPEIVFLAFSRPRGGPGNENSNAILRVLHGGGTDEMMNSKKGKEYLSVCGDSRAIGGKFLDNADAELTDPDCTVTEAKYDTSSTVAVGDLDYDGIPEIVIFGETTNSDGFSSGNPQGYIFILDNQGRELFDSGLISFDSGNRNSGECPPISLANVIQDPVAANELVEIVVGRDLFVMKKDLEGKWGLDKQLAGDSASGTNEQGPISCVADLVPARPGKEIVAGGSVYGIPLVGKVTDGVFDTSAGGLVTLGKADGVEGFCAIADVWGADRTVAPGPSNPLDRQPEIVLISGGKLLVYSLDITAPVDDAGDFSIELMPVVDGLGRFNLSGTAGGAPNIDDFDGDGFPEIGTADNVAYTLFDLQDPTDSGGACQEWKVDSDNQTDNPRNAPSGDCANDAVCNSGESDKSKWLFACNETANIGKGECVCLHNGWKRPTEDRSSQVTGSSVFDFNGDGAAEVIYNDECSFRLYSGIDGSELFKEPSESRTRIEYPIVADIDNDGNAEIVFATTTESGFCSEGGTTYNAGIEVWGDPSDRWVSARRVWNQYSYHVTNVNESGGIPRDEPSSWLPLGERFYNTYRSQPRAFGSAPDLVVDGIQVVAPGKCGSSKDLLIGTEVRNAGDLRVSGIPVRFEGTWDSEMVTEALTDANGDPLEYLITQTLEPEASVVFQLAYAASNNSRNSFPDSVRVIIDPVGSVNDGLESGVARECNEDNNSESATVDAAPSLPDLSVTLNDPSEACKPIVVVGTVKNLSDVAAADVVVRIYAGDPASGAAGNGEIIIGSIPAGGSVDFDTSTDTHEHTVRIPNSAPVSLFAEVDPDDTVAECNESNNGAGPTARTNCLDIR